MQRFMNSKGVSANRHGLMKVIVREPIEHGKQDLPAGGPCRQQSLAGQNAILEFLITVPPRLLAIRRPEVNEPGSQVPRNVPDDDDNRIAVTHTRSCKLVVAQL